MTYTVDPAELDAATDLLETLLKRPAWHADAACRGMGPARWFPGRGESSAPATAICATCPVREECNAYANGIGPTLEGVWAGVPAKSRRAA